jgi:hypothetical protein
MLSAWIAIRCFKLNNSCFEQKWKKWAKQIALAAGEPNFFI